MRWPRPERRNQAYSRRGSTATPASRTAWATPRGKVPGSMERSTELAPAGSGSGCCSHHQPAAPTAIAARRASRKTVLKKRRTSLLRPWNVPAMIIQAMSHPLHGVASLPYLGVIRVQGEDAARFLQGQLTQDFALLGPAEARLAAFCNAKGRMQASFIGFRRGPDEILLVCSRDVLPATLKRLSMFVLRAKAKLTDASGEFVLHGTGRRGLRAADAQLRIGGRRQLQEGLLSGPGSRRPQPVPRHPEAARLHRAFRR